MALLLLLGSNSALGEEPRPRLGLALGGGSARGLAHVGVLEVLEEHGIPVDVVVGTSMGACVGALYASGHSAAEVGAVVREIDWERIFQGRAERHQEPVAWRVDDVPAILSAGLRGRRLLAPYAAVSDYRISRLLTEHLAAAGLRAGGDFDRLPTPFRSVATDLRTGERVVLGRGDLPRAVRASMSLPVVFPPVEFDGRLLVDGALSDNLPAGLARELGADLVIAVDVSAPPAELGVDAGVLEVVGRLMDLMMSQDVEDAEERPDVLIRPLLQGIEAGDFSRYEDAIAAGRSAALLALPEIERLLGARPRGARGKVPGIDEPQGTVTAVSIVGARGVGEELIRRRLGVVANAPFDLAAALRGLDAVWSSNLFSSTSLEIAGDGEGLAVTARVRERPVTRLGLGLSYNESDNLRAFLRYRHGNLLGQGERLDLVGRFDSSLAQFEASLGSTALGGGLFGYRVGGRLEEDKPKLYDVSSEELVRARFRHESFSGGVHRAIGSVGLVEVGLLAGRSRIDQQPGTPYASRTDTVVQAGVRFVADTLDDRFFATRGVRAVLHAEEALAGLGASLDHGRAWGRVDGYVPFGRVGLLEVHAFLGGSHGEVPAYDLFRLGGPDLVPGRAREELWDRWAGAASLGLGARLGRSLRLYVRGGAGNAWSDAGAVGLGDLRAGGSLGIAYNTRLGPGALELGVGAGRLRVYVSLGFQ
jgi:NTE family protein